MFLGDGAKLCKTSLVLLDKDVTVERGIASERATCRTLPMTGIVNLNNRIVTDIKSWQEIISGTSKCINVVQRKLRFLQCCGVEAEVILQKPKLLIGMQSTEDMIGSV